MKLIAKRDFQSTIIGSVSKGDDLASRISTGYAKALIEAGVIDVIGQAPSEMSAPPADQVADQAPADQVADQAPAKPGRKAKTKAE